MYLIQKKGLCVVYLVRREKNENTNDYIRIVAPCLHVLTCCITGRVSTACSSDFPVFSWVRLLPYLCGTETYAEPVVHPPDIRGISACNYFI
jgi:hypothetical protein